MSLKKKIEKSTLDCLANKIKNADAIVIGAGAGLSASAGYNYSQERFMKYFSDFNEKYGINDMYYGSFYPFDDELEYWSFWARKIYYNRYFDDSEGINDLYSKIFNLVKDKNYFVITSNADHLFRRNNFEKDRLFYMQGDYGLFQCEVPCQQVTFDNKQMILDMLESQDGMKISKDLIPTCPNCGKKLTVNLRKDEFFVQDKGWELASKRYIDFLNNNISKNILFLELGIGMNTPGIIKYPFIKMTAEHDNAFYISINFDNEFNADNIKSLGADISNQSLFINADIYEVFSQIT